MDSTQCWVSTIFYGSWGVLGTDPGSGGHLAGLDELSCYEVLDLVDGVAIRSSAQGPGAAGTGDTSSALPALRLGLVSSGSDPHLYSHCTRGGSHDFSDVIGVSVFEWRDWIWQCPGEVVRHHFLQLKAQPGPSKAMQRFPTKLGSFQSWSTGTEGCYAVADTI